MNALKDFLLENVSPTKRKSIQHLQQMKPTDFVALVRALSQHFPSGNLTSVDIDLKVDGIGFRFGKDTNGRPFVESSHSGPVYEPGTFVAYAKQRNDPGMLGRAEKIEEIFTKIVQSDLMVTVPKDRKVVCEVLYNPLGKISATGIKFSSTEYDHNKLGRVMTIAPFRVLVASTGQRAPDEKQTLESLLEVSNADVKVISTRLSYEPIDISATINAVNTLTPGVLNILQSRKESDQEAKDVVKQTIQALKDQLADVILQHKGYRGKDVLGDQIEGLVLSFGGHQVKMTTPQMKQAVATRRAERVK